VRDKLGAPPPQPFERSLSLNSVMSGRVFLKQVPDLSSLYEAAAAEAQDAEAVPSTNQHGWIEKKCGPACEKMAVVKLLLEKGAELESEGKYGQLPSRISQFSFLKYPLGILKFLI
jgi:putative N-acetylmannosamine-6-phosphate epimerase